MNKKKIYFKLFALLTAVMLMSGSLFGQTIKGHEKEVISLSTIQCNNCVRTIEKSLTKVQGIIEVNVNLEKKQAEVIFENTLTNLGAIEKAITDAGYNANEKVRDETAYNKLKKCCKGE
jgi:copper chaperone